MTSAFSVGARSLAPLAVAGALLSVLSIYAGTEPAPLLPALQGTTVSAVVVFAALVACGLWVLRHASASAWRWASAIGVVAASAQLVGLSLRRYDGLLLDLLQDDTIAWTVVQWLGTAWMATAGVAALIAVLDAYGAKGAADVDGEGTRAGVLTRLVESLTSADLGRQRTGLLVVGALLTLSRLPYLLVYWPGIVHFDTFRSLSYARGTGPWQTYEPVGHSLHIAGVNWLGSSLGLGDAGIVALAATIQILASSAALAFMLARMAAWGVPQPVWVAAFAWLALHPVLGYLSVTVVKDVPFTIAVVVFAVSVGELSLRRAQADTWRWWPWVTLAISGIFVSVLRNNGIYIVALSLLVLLVVFRHRWRPLLGVFATVVLAYGVYVGPIYTALQVQPGPKEEAYSVPIQQLGRIAKYQAAELDATDRAFMVRVFRQSPEELGSHYVPQLTDPMKLSTRDAWNSGLGTSEFLAGWARIVAEHPETAIEATLANTMGYWNPVGSSYDGLVRWSVNDIRGISLDIPSGEPTDGVAAMIEASGIMPTKNYFEGMQDDGYLAIPLVGAVMSPGFVVWLWMVAALLVARMRNRVALAVFVPAGVLLLSFLAGPVSGGQRYALALYMALPLAIAAVVLASRRSGASSGRERESASPSMPQDAASVSPSDPRQTVAVR